MLTSFFCCSRPMYVTTYQRSQAVVGCMWIPSSPWTIIRHTNDQWIPVSRDILRTVLWVCGLSSWLRTKSLAVSTFSSVRALRGLPLPGRLSTVPVSRNFFKSLLTLSFVQLYSWNSSVNLFAVYPFNYKLFLLNSSPRHGIPCHCNDVCCYVFPVPQIDSKT